MKYKLEVLLEVQAKLNDEIFKKKRIGDANGQPLAMDTLQVIARAFSKPGAPSLGPNSSVNKWLRNFLDALNDESRELGEELLWKWWSKDTLDMQNIRVEIIDMLHFWLSLALTAGLDADKIYDIYMQKNKVNLERQENGYSKETKNENDNKGIN